MSELDWLNDDERGLESVAMTNAEYIRNMSDEKLAAWLWNHIDHNAFCGKMCVDKQPHKWCWKSPLVEKCADKMLEWLQQEHKEREEDG